MAEFPALPLWTDAYLGDTTHLSTIEHGAYLLLLFTAWRTPTYDLPDDDILLAKYCRLTNGQWARIKPVIMAYWKLKNGRWFNGRLLDERDAVRRKVAQRSDAGKASALKRLHRSSTDVQREGNETSTSKATATPITSSKKEISPAKAVAVKIPIIGFNEFYQAYPKRVARGAAEKAYRKAITRSSHTIILGGACRHATATIGQDRQFIQNPATWLNADGWLDEIQPQTNGYGNGRQKQSAHSKFAEGAYLAAIEGEPGMENGGIGHPDAIGHPLLETRLRTEPD